MSHKKKNYKKNNKKNPKENKKENKKEKVAINLTLKCYTKSILKNTYLKDCIYKNGNILKKIVNEYSLFFHMFIILSCFVIAFFSKNELYHIIIINLIIVDAIVITILQEYHYDELKGINKEKKKGKSFYKEIKREYEYILFYENQADLLIHICTFLTCKLIMIIGYKMYYYLM
jgi:hypothetical protein